MLRLIFVFLKYALAPISNFCEYVKLTAPQITDIGHTLLYAHPDNNYALKLFTSKGKLRLSVKFLTSTLNHSVIFDCAANRYCTNFSRTAIMP